MHFGAQNSTQLQFPLRYTLILNSTSMPVCNNRHSGSTQNRYAAGLTTPNTLRTWGQANTLAPGHSFHLGGSLLGYGIAWAWCNLVNCTGVVTGCTSSASFDICHDLVGPWLALYTGYIYCKHVLVVSINPQYDRTLSFLKVARIFCQVSKISYTLKI